MRMVLVGAGRIGAAHAREDWSIGDGVAQFIADRF